MKIRILMHIVIDQKSNLFQIATVLVEKICLFLHCDDLNQGMISIQSNNDRIKCRVPLYLLLKTIFIIQNVYSCRLFT